MVLIFKEKKVGYLTLDNNLEENSKINVIEWFVRQFSEGEMVIVQPECVNIKCHIKLFTFSFSERIPRPAEQKVMEFNKPFDTISSAHAGEICAG